MRCVGRDEASGATVIPMRPLIARRKGQVQFRPHGPRASTAHVLTYVEEGRVSVDQSGVVHAASGSLLISPAGMSHRAVHGEGLTLHLVGFVPTSYGLDETQTLMSPFAKVRHGALPQVVVPRARRGRVLQLMADLRAEEKARHPESPELRRAGLRLLLGEALRAMPRAASPPPTLSARALTFVQRHAFEPIGLREVATAVHRSPGHVATVVKQETGHTVGDWIATARLAEAASRLEHTDASVAEIGECVGWPDPTHFIRRFRRHFGLTPAAWRARTCDERSK